MLPLVVAAVGGFLGGSVAVGLGCAVAQSMQESDAGPSDSSTRMLPAENIPEHDKTIRRCTVYLFTRPVEGVEKIDINPTRHWALVFYFEDDYSIRVLEGQQDASGQLNAYILKQGPKDVSDPKFYKLGVICMSPSQLRDLAVNNPLNHTKYYIATNNCQNWVKAFAKGLNDRIEEKLKSFHTLQEVNPIFAHSWSFANKSSASIANSIKSSNVTQLCHVPSHRI